MPIRHVVMWKLKDPADGPFFRAELLGCATLVPGILGFHVALRSAGLEANVDVMLDATFADEAALESYQHHPHHKAVSARIGPLRETRHVLDYAVPDAAPGAGPDAPFDALPGADR